MPETKHTPEWGYSIDDDHEGYVVLFRRIRGMPGDCKSNLLTIDDAKEAERILNSHADLLEAAGRVVSDAIAGAEISLRPIGAPYMVSQDCIDQLRAAIAKPKGE